MHLVDRSPVVIERVRSDFPAHRRLVEALLRAGEPGFGAPSYALLWQRAAAEQQQAGRRPYDAERRLELLVTEVRALERVATWFRADPALRAAAVNDTVSYWSTGEPVAGRYAHEAWRRCWESRSAAGLAGCECRLSDEWATAWWAWSRTAAQN